MKEEELSEPEEPSTPPDVLEESANTSLELLPQKSRMVYEKRYSDFMKWCESKKIIEYTEEAMLSYFSEQCKIFKSSTIWSIFSMLKCTLAVKHNLNIGHYNKVISFIKQQGVGYQPKKSKTLSKNEILQFLKEAPDEKYLMIKVALIFGICGGCRRHELYNLTAEDIKEIKNILVITTTNMKTHKPRTFTVINDEETDIDYLGLYRKYADLRLNKSAGKRKFFLKYDNGRCTNQVVGINTFGRLPSIIAKYLNLENPHLFTGHCFRRSSTTLLASGGADLIKLKRHGWTSSTVVEGSIDDSFTSKIETVSKILESSPAPRADSANVKMDISSGDFSLSHATITNTECFQSNSSETCTLSTSGVNIQNCSNFTINLTINNHRTNV